MFKKDNWNILLGILTITVGGVFIQRNVKADISVEQQQLINQQVRMDKSNAVPGQLIIGMADNAHINLEEASRTNLFGIEANILENLSLKKSTKNKSPRQVLLVQFNTESNLPEVIDHLTSLPEVDYAEPNYIVKVDDDQSEKQDIIPDSLQIFNPSQLTPNDNFWRNMWGLTKINIPATWNKNIGSREVKVAIVDSGVEYTHEDLKDNVDASLGYDFVDNDNDPNDEHGHGTHVAGTIGAKGNNKIGVPGVNWDVTMVPLRVLNEKNTGTNANFIRAINWATEKNIPLINYSIHSTSYTYSLEQAINNYPGLFIAAAGNYNEDYSSLPIYPASLKISNMITVGNSNSNDQRYSSSSYSKTGVDLFAPGREIYSTRIKNSYAYDTRTSMAAPHVTGSAALALSQNPNLTPLELKNSILESVDKKDALKDLCQTGGRLNTYKLLNLIEDIPIDSADTWDKNTAYWQGDRVIYNGKEYEAKWWNLNSKPDKSGIYGSWKEV